MSDGGGRLSGQTRADFVRSAVDGCVTRQKASPDNANIAPDMIASFCDCYAEALATRVSTTDVESLTGSSAADMQAAMRPKMAESESACFAELDKG